MKHEVFLPAAALERAFKLPRHLIPRLALKGEVAFRQLQNGALEYKVDDVRVCATRLIAGRSKARRYDYARRAPKGAHGGHA